MLPFIVTAGAELIWLREICFQSAELCLKQGTKPDTKIGLYSVTDVKFAIPVTVSCHGQIHWGVRERSKRKREEGKN